MVDKNVWLDMKCSTDNRCMIKGNKWTFFIHVWITWFTKLDWYLNCHKNISIRTYDILQFYLTIGLTTKYVSQLHDFSMKCNINFDWNFSQEIVVQLNQVILMDPEERKLIFLYCHIYSWTITLHYWSY